MALVRVSEVLVAEVGKQVDAISKKAYDLSVAPLNPTKASETMDAIYAAATKQLWSKYEHLRNIVPVEWLKDSNRVDVKITDAPSIGELMIEKRIQMPPNAQAGYGYVEVRLKLADLPFDLMAKMAAFNTASTEHAKKFDQIKAQVVGFLENSRSLNDALKRFPDLALYIPKEFLDRVERKVARAASVLSEPLKGIEIDRGMIVAAGVLGALQK